MTDLRKKNSYKEISEDVNKFVSSKLDGYDVYGIEAKTIHDPIWGSNEYSEWEMQLIDSPLLQRLRNISQVGLAVLTYPAARHSRFEHTLGVAAATKRLVDRINANCENFVISPEVKCKLVLAAIMHDVGHCFYSHLSESVYGNLADFVQLRQDIQKIYSVKPKPHEILSLIIVNSTAFKEFFKDHVNYPYKANGVTAIEELTFCKIMLFSYIYYHQKVLITEDIIKDYVQALLKLDLINSYSDFLMYDEAALLCLAEKQDEKKPFPEYGNINLTQLASNIKNRVLPKRCLEISQSIIQGVAIEESNKVAKCAMLLERIRTDSDYSAQDLDVDMNRMISDYTRSDARYIAGFMSKFESNTFEQTLKLRKQIFDALVRIYQENDATVDFDTFDIYFVFPSIVSYGTPGEKNVLGRDGQLMSINDFVRLEQWASSFNAYKWRGYVYVTKRINKEYALEACRQVIFDGKVDLHELKAFLKF